MDRKENYYEDESAYTDEGELTLKGVGKFLKRAWLRTLIYLLVTSMLATVAFVGVKFLGKTDYFISATVEFTFKGVSSGKNPDGTVFDKDDILSINNVKDAIVEVGFNDKIVKNGDVTAARNRLSMTAIMPKEYVQKYNELVSGDMKSADAYAQLATMQYYPTKFVINFRDYEALGLNKDEAIKLIDKIIEIYGTRFAEEHYAAVVLSKRAFTIGTSEDTGDASMLDYIDYVDNFASAYSTISRYLADMAVKYPLFTSKKGKGFTSFQSELNSLESQLSTLRAYVSDNNISNNIGVMKSSTKTQIERLTRESARLEGLIASTEKQITSIKPTQISVVDSTGTTTMTTAYPQVYYDLHEALQSYTLQKSTNDLQLSEKTELMTKIKDAIDETGLNEITEAEKYLKAIRSNSIDFVNEVNDASKENAEKNTGANSIGVVSPATYVTKSLAFPTMLVYLSSAGLAIAVGFIVTYILGKRSKARKEAEAKAAEAMAAESDRTEKKQQA